MKMNLSSAVKMVHLAAITTILTNVEFLTVLLLLHLLLALHQVLVVHHLAVPLQVQAVHLQVLLAYLVKLSAAMFV